MGRGLAIGRAFAQRLPDPPVLEDISVTFADGL